MPLSLCNKAGVVALALALTACDERNDKRAAPTDTSEDSQVDSGAEETDRTDAEAGESDTGEPEAQVEKLSETGLYADIAAGTLADGVSPFVPAGVLWSDGADKRRWIYLPPGTQIDSSNMDAWRLPVGAKLWKEFSLGGKRLETRLLEKTGPDTWRMLAFQWREDQRDALATPDGLKNVAGTQHDIPSQKECKRCHEGVADAAIGFSALLLAHAEEGATLDSLTKSGKLSRAPDAPLVVPGGVEERKVLLYLHANCGNCHNDRTFISNVTNVDYTLKAAGLGAVDQTNAYRTLLRDLRKNGSVEQTDAMRRMGFRGIQGQMPPIGSEIVDADGLSLLRRWLTVLAAQTDAGADGGSDAGGADAASPDAGL